MSTGTSMFLWLQDCVLLWPVRMMINGYDDPALYLKCHKGSRNKSQVYKILGDLDQGASSDLPAVLGLL